MTIRTPCMEWEKCSKNAETNEYEWEEYLLNIYWNIMKGCDCIEIHCLCSTEIVDTQNTNNQQSTTTHQHQGKLHSCIFLRTCSPYTNKKVHWYQCYFIEHEHGEDIGRNKEAEHTNTQKNEPKKIFFLHRFQLPRSKSTCKDYNSRKQNHDNRNAINTHTITDMERSEPWNTVS